MVVSPTVVVRGSTLVCHSLKEFKGKDRRYGVGSRTETGVAGPCSVVAEGEPDTVFGELTIGTTVGPEG